MKLLQAARLSRLADASTGIDKQDLDAQRFADLGGHVIVATAPDTDVSGDVSPWDRPKLGPWLTDAAMIAQYDGIIASHIDRLSRNTVHFMRLLQWADDHGKVIITTGEQGIDFGSPVGKLLGYIISWLGEQELAAIKRRSVSTQKWLRDNEYFSGKQPWGFRIVPKGDHTTLEPDPTQAPYLVAAVKRYLAGNSIAEVSNWLNSEGVPAAKGGQWSATTLNYVLRNPILIGRRVNRKKRTILKVPALLDQSTWQQLQAKLDANSKRRGPQGNPAMLKGVLLCATCERPMYRKARTAKGVTYAYYRCQGQCHNSIRAAELDARVNEAVMAYGWAPHTEKIAIRGRGHEDEIAEVEQDIKELDFDDVDYDENHAALVAERRRLRSLPAEPDRIEEVPTGQTIAEYWQAQDEQGKRAWLLERGWKVYAQKSEDGEIIPTIEGGDYFGDLKSLGGPAI